MQLELILGARSFARKLTNEQLESIVDEACRRDLRIIRDIQQQSREEAKWDLLDCADLHVHEASANDLIRALIEGHGYDSSEVVIVLTGLNLVRLYEDLISERYEDVLCNIDKIINPAHLSESDLMRARIAKSNATSAAA